MRYGAVIGAFRESQVDNIGSIWGLGGFPRYFGKFQSIFVGFQRCLGDVFEGFGKSQVRYLGVREDFGGISGSF